MAEQSSGTALEVEHLQPPDLYQSLDLSYTQVVTARGGKTVYLAGMVAWDADRNIVGKGDLARQTEQILTNMRTALAAVGGTLANVVATRTYIVNYHLPEDTDAILAVRVKFFPADKPPTSTFLGVQALADEELLLEIDAVAVVP